MKWFFLGIVLVGFCPKVFALVGNFDPNFGNGTGRVAVNCSETSDQACASLLQEDGRIIVIGQGYMFEEGDNWPVARLARLLSNGMCDNSFGTEGNGFVTLKGLEYACAIAMQPDGKILVGGTTDNNFMAVRLLRSGQVDQTFAPAVTNFAATMNEARAMEVQNDGKVVMAGISDDALAVARFNSDGTPDLGFGPDGTGEFKLSMEYAKTAAHALAMQDDGCIVIGGAVTETLTNMTNFLLLRLTENGMLDPSFGQEGSCLAVIDFGAEQDVLNAITLDKNGWILAVGRSGTATEFDAALAQVDFAGALDTTFGNNGLALLDLSTYQTELNAVQIQDDQKIVASGHVNQDGHDNFALVRLMPSGACDNCFGNNGAVIFDFADNAENDRAVSVLLQADSKILLVGTCNSANGASIMDGISLLDNFAVSRHLVEPLIITQEASEKNPCPGQNILYTITVLNCGGGGGTVRGILIEDVHPDDLILRSGSATKGTFDPVQRTWHIPSLQLSEQAVLKIKARVGQFAGDEVIQNSATAQFSSIDSVTDSSLFDGMSSIDLPVVSAVELITTQSVIHENINHVAHRTDCGLDSLSIDFDLFNDQFAQFKDEVTQNNAAIKQQIEVILTKLNCLFQSISFTDCI